MASPAGWPKGADFRGFGGFGDHGRRDCCTLQRRRAGCNADSRNADDPMPEETNMTRKAIMLAAVVMLAGIHNARAQELRPVPATVVATPECTTCSPCANGCDAPMETRSGLIIRIQKQSATRRAEKSEKCLVACCDKPKSKCSKLSEWLCYKPEHRGELCGCKQCGGCFVIPLWTFFPCQGCGGGSICAGANESCAAGGSSKGCKTCGGAASSSASNPPCLICSFHKD